MNAAFGLWSEGYGQPVQWLAIAGGAAVGAVGADVATRLLVRGLTTRKTPRFALTSARGLGAIAVGFLTALWVWQGGTWGPGGPGGPGPGSAANPEQGTPPDDKKAAPVEKDKTASPTPEVTLRVEVLNDRMIEDMGQTQAEGEQRYYRLPESGDPKALHTLAEVEEAIKQRRGKEPPLQYLVIAGPDKTAGRVALLQQWAEERGLKVGNIPWP